MSNDSAEDLLQALYDYFHIPSSVKKKHRKKKKDEEYQLDLLSPDMVKELMQLRDQRSISRRITYVGQAK